MPRDEGSAGGADRMAQTLTPRQAARAMAERRTRLTAADVDRAGDSGAVTRTESGQPSDYAGNDRRRARRRHSPLRAIIDGQRYEIVNWSANGFLITDFRAGKVTLGQPFLLTIAIPLSGPQGHARIRVRVTRYDAAKGLLAFAFGQSVDDRTLEILTRYATD
jgi:hypothetical protein